MAREFKVGDKVKLIPTKENISYLKHHVDDVNKPYFIVKKVETYGVTISLVEDNPNLGSFSTWHFSDRFELYDEKIHKKNQSEKSNNVEQPNRPVKMFLKKDVVEYIGTQECYKDMIGVVLWSDYENNKTKVKWNGFKHLSSILNSNDLTILKFTPVLTEKTSDYYRYDTMGMRLAVTNDYL